MEAHLNRLAICYEKLQQCSVPEFKSFLDETAWCEKETFEALNSAFLKVNVKEINLPTDLQTFVRWKLSDYAFRNLTGNWGGTKDPHEWKHHIDTVLDCWRVICAKYDPEKFDDMDAAFRHRLHVIHNHLFFLKTVKCLQYLPIIPTMYCVAVFLSIHQHPANFLEYRLIVNKGVVMEFLQMICRQLKGIKEHLPDAENRLTQLVNDIRTVVAVESKPPKAKKSKVKVKQSKAKLTTEQSGMEREPTESTEDQGAQQRNPEPQIEEDESEENKLLREKIKIEFNVTDEIKSKNLTKSLRILCEKKPLPADQLVSEIIIPAFYNWSHLLKYRDRRTAQKVTKCYGRVKSLYSVKKALLYSETHHTEHPKDPKVLSACLRRTMQTLGEVLKNTSESPNMPGTDGDSLRYGTLLYCSHTREGLREIYSHGSRLSTKLYEESVLNMDKPIFESLGTLKPRFQLAYASLTQTFWRTFYGQLMRCKTVEMIRSLFRYVGDVADIETLADRAYIGYIEFIRECNIQISSPDNRDSKFWLQGDHLAVVMHYKWKMIEQQGALSKRNDWFRHVELRQVCQLVDDLSVIRRVLQWKLNDQTMRNLRNQLKYHAGSPGSQAFLGDYTNNEVILASAVMIDVMEKHKYIRHTRSLTEDFGIAEQVDDVMLEALNNRLHPYYTKLFEIDIKTKVVKDFCTSRNIPFNEKLAKQIYERDQRQREASLQYLRGMLRAILEEHGIRTVSDLLERSYSLPQHAVAALEQFQLELCEALETVKYFGDSYYYLTQRVQTIQGKSYRNYLAHDSVMYDLLVDTSKQQPVINAFVMAHANVNFFKRHTKGVTVNDTPMIFPSVEDTHRWIAEDVHYGAQQRVVRRTACEVADVLQESVNTYWLLHTEWSVLEKIQLATVLHLDEELEQLCECIDSADTIKEQLLGGCFDMLEETCAKPTGSYQIVHAQEYRTLISIAAQANNISAAFFLLEHEKFQQYKPEMLDDCCVVAAEAGLHTFLMTLHALYPIAELANPARAMHAAALNEKWPCVQLYLDAKVSVDEMFPASRDSLARMTVLSMLVRSGQTRPLDRLQKVDIKGYREDFVSNPLEIAVNYLKDSSRMVSSLNRLGFGWLDSSRILYVAIVVGLATSKKHVHAKPYILSKQILKGNTSTQTCMDSIWREIADRMVHRAGGRFAELLNVLERWHLIGYLEEPTELNASVFKLAMEYVAHDTMEVLLALKQELRTIEGKGVLSRIVFKIGQETVCFGSRDSEGCLRTRSSCLELTTNLKTLETLSEGMCWKEFTVEAGVRVTFTVLGELDQTVHLKLSNPSALLESFAELVAFSDAAFDSCPLVLAWYEDGCGSVKHFLNVDGIHCMYDLLPQGTFIDVFESVETPPINCFFFHDHRMTKLLVENGANPLLDKFYVTNMIENFFCIMSTFQYLVKECMQRDLRDAEGRTILQRIQTVHWDGFLGMVTMLECKEIVQLLLDYNVDMTVKRQDGATPLQVAVRREGTENVDIVKMLLDLDPTQINIIHENYGTLVHMAVTAKLFKVVKLLLQYNPDITIEFRRLTPVCLALQTGEVEMAMLILRHATGKAHDFNAFERIVTKYFDRLMTYCIGNEYKELMQFLIDNNVNMKNQLDLGLTPIQAAILRAAGPSVEIAKMLLAKDSSCVNDVHDDYGTLLHMAVSINSLEVLKLLLKYNPDITIEHRLGTPVCFALKPAKVHMAILLLTHAAERAPESSAFERLVTEHYNRLMIFCIANDCVELLQLLIDRNVKMHNKLHIGFNPVQAAVYKSAGPSLQIAKMLLDKDCSQINDVHEEYGTLLHTAVEIQSLELLQLLLKYNPDITIQHRWGTPVCFALDRATVDMAILLLRHAAERAHEEPNAFELIVTKYFDRLVTFCMGNDCTDLLRLLIDNNVNMNKTLATGLTPVQVAICLPYGVNFPMVEMLLDADRTIMDTVDEKRGTLLHLALRRKSLPLLELLLRYEPDLSLEFRSSTPLVWALNMNLIDHAKLLLNHALERGTVGATNHFGVKSGTMTSFTCDDYDLSVALFEYELGHSLRECGVVDIELMEANLKFVPLMQHCVLEESNRFLIHLCIIYDWMVENKRFIEEVDFDM